MRPVVDFSDALAKLRHAEECLKLLEDEVTKYAQGDFRETTAEFYGQREIVGPPRKVLRSKLKELGLEGTPTVRQVDGDTVEIPVAANYYRILHTIREPIPAIRWGVLIGDILNNQRAALDNFIWALTVVGANPPPNPIPHAGILPWRTVAFPVTIHQMDWPGRLTRYIWGIGSFYQARLKELQPFNSGQDCEFHWLRMLDELWNADKHRVLTVVRTVVTFGKAEFAPSEGEPMSGQDFAKAFDARLFYERPPGPFQSQTEEIARFWIAPRPPHYQVPAELQMDVKIQTPFYISFDETSPGYGYPIIEILRDFTTRIQTILADINAPSLTNDPTNSRFANMIIHPVTPTPP